MFTLLTKKATFFSRRYIWFYNNTPIELGDITIFIHAYSYPISKNAIAVDKVFTTSIDLTASLEEIKSNLKTKLRGYINKGTRIDFEYFQLDVTDKSNQKNIINDYNNFAKSKKIALLNEKLFLDYCLSGAIVATQIIYEGKPLITHVYLNDTERAFLFHSFHLAAVFNYDGQFKGTANRYLHWMDIEYFKSLGLKKYDLGGIASDEDSSLRDFKMSFGGIIEEHYGYIIPKGFFKLIYYILDLKNRFLLA